jgi:hypothetical protein
MSGEGSLIVGFAAFERDSGRVAFDQRPGALEATRIEPASGILVTGSRGGAARGAWPERGTVRGEDGTFCQVPLPIEAARKLAGELTEMADTLEGRVW